MQQQPLSAQFNQLNQIGWPDNEIRTLYIIRLWDLPTSNTFKRVIITWLKLKIEKYGIIFCKCCQENKEVDDSKLDFLFPKDIYYYFHFTHYRDFDTMKKMLAKKNNDFENELHAHHYKYSTNTKDWTRNEFMVHYLHCKRCLSKDHDVDSEYCFDCREQMNDVKKMFLVPKANYFYEEWERQLSDDVKAEEVKWEDENKTEVETWLRQCNINPVVDICHVVYTTECRRQRNDDKTIKQLKSTCQPRNWYCVFPNCTFYHNEGQHFFGDTLREMIDKHNDNDHEHDNKNDTDNDNDNDNDTDNEEKDVDELEQVVKNFVEPKIEAIQKEMIEEAKAYEQIDLHGSWIQIEKDLEEKSNEITLYFDSRNYKLKNNDVLILSNFKPSSQSQNETSNDLKQQEVNNDKINGLHFIIVEQTYPFTKAIFSQYLSKTEFPDAMFNKSMKLEGVADIDFDCCLVPFETQMDHLMHLVDDAASFPHLKYCLNRLEQPQRMDIDNTRRNHPLLQAIQNKFLNKRQQEALWNILSYDVSLTQGPPGTGKTCVIAAAILCHKILFPNEKVIAMAPSNVGTDNILKMVHRIIEDKFIKSQSGYEAIENFKIARILAPRLMDIQNDDNKHIVDYYSYIKARKSRKDLQLGTAMMKKFDWHLRLHHEDLFLAVKDIHDIPLIEEALHKHDSSLVKCLEEIHILESDIIITTPVLSKIRICKKMPFRLRILDEANQSSMSEGLLALIQTNSKKIALVGDIQQLEPVLKTEMGEKHLKTSLLKLFQVDHGYKNVIQLQVQYRMASKIREIVSNTFYKQPLIDSDEIENKGVRLLEEEQCKHLKKILTGPKTGRRTLTPENTIPIMFCDCDGEDKGESNSLQSIFGYNILKKLICEGNFEPKDCCVLSYYQAQTLHFQKYGHSLMFAGMLWEFLKPKCCHENQDNRDNCGTDPNIVCEVALRIYNTTNKMKQKKAPLKVTGPFDLKKIVIKNINAVEGQEKECVIVLTTRCNSNMRLGFVESPNHLNVAISRAKQLCFIIGNARTLSNNAHWNYLFHYLHDQYQSFGCGEIFEGAFRVQYDKSNQSLPFFKLKLPIKSSNYNSNIDHDNKESFGEFNRYVKSKEKKCLNCKTKILHKYTDYELQTYCRLCWFARNKSFSIHPHYKTQFILIDLTSEYEKCKKIVSFKTDMEIQNLFKKHKELLQSQIYEESDLQQKFTNLWDEFQHQNDCDKQTFMKIVRMIRNHLIDEIKNKLEKNPQTLLQSFDNQYDNLKFGEDRWWKQGKFAKFPSTKIIETAMQLKLALSCKKIADLERDLVTLYSEKKNSLTRSEVNTLFKQYCDQNIQPQQSKLAIHDLFAAMQQDKTSLIHENKAKKIADKLETKCKVLLKNLKMIDAEFDFVEESKLKEQNKADADFTLKKPLLIILNSKQYYIVNWIDVKDYYISCASDCRVKKLNYQIQKFNSQYGSGCYLCSAGINSIYSSLSELEFHLLGTCILPYELLEKWVNQRVNKKIEN